jgi:hypothetical protein
MKYLMLRGRFNVNLVFNLILNYPPKCGKFLEKDS